MTKVEKIVGAIIGALFIFLMLTLPAFVNNCDKALERAQRIGEIKETCKEYSKTMEEYENCVSKRMVETDVGQ